MGGIDPIFSQKFFFDIRVLFKDGVDFTDYNDFTLHIVKTYF